LYHESRIKYTHHYQCLKLVHFIYNVIPCCW